MAISMRALLSRGIPGEIVSFQQALARHPFGLTMGLREVHSRLLQPVDGNGFARGCRRAEDIVIHVEEFITGRTLSDRPIGGVLPEWVPVTGNTRLVRDHTGEHIIIRLIPDHAGETRTVEGILTISKVTDRDFPLLPWHKYYDWNFIIRVDPQYTYLLSQAIIEAPNPRWRGGNFECEWDTGFLPSFAWPQEGDRVWLVGRWIYDCGHLHGETGKHRTELHPVKAVASFRSEAVTLPGNSGPTRANNAVLYIGRKGGYWDQPINDQDYVFDLDLPPTPHPEAEPTWKVMPMTGRLPVQPELTPFPADRPQALRVIIPLKGVEPHPAEYGAIISAGWRDPAGTESRNIRHVRVTLENILDFIPPLYYIGVNGRWTIGRWIIEPSGTLRLELSLSVELFLHPEDQIHVTACGFKPDAVHKLIGRATGVDWAHVSDPSQSNDIKQKIIDGFLSLGGWEFIEEWGEIENSPIDLFSKRHPPSVQGRFTESSNDGQYRLQYRIDRL